MPVLIKQESFAVSPKKYDLLWKPAVLAFILLYLKLFLTHPIQYLA